MITGLLLLTGGQGRRMGGPKHALAHPAGGTWGGHLVRTFEAAFPGGPIHLLGAPLPDRPELCPLEDPRQGPGVALRAWAGASGPQAGRWWLAACDQVRFTPERLLAWSAQARAADPEGARWVVARHQGRVQPLGGWLPEALRPVLASTSGLSLLALVEALPHLCLDQDGPEWLDADTPAERARFEREC